MLKAMAPYSFWGFGLPCNWMLLYFDAPGDRWRRKKLKPKRPKAKYTQIDTNLHTTGIGKVKLGERYCHWIRRHDPHSTHKSWHPGLQFW